MLESSKFDCPILTEHNFILGQHILMKFSGNCQNISFYWPAKFYLIIFKTDWFIAKTKRVSVQLGHSVFWNWHEITYLSIYYRQFNDKFRILANN